MARKPPVVWHPAHRSNYTAASRRAKRLDMVVIHVTQGSYSSAISWFQTRRAGASAHYVVRSRDGKIAQCVSAQNIAWHAGDWHVNRTSIGIEHEGFFDDPDWFTAQMYRSSARLVAYLCKKHGIPINRQHIVGHDRVANTRCPGSYWWWDHYMKLVQRYA
jgi:N-acetyl-anhydromuramyl-L-alanine amidase AmpD